MLRKRSSLNRICIAGFFLLLSAGGWALEEDSPTASVHTFWRSELLGTVTAPGRMLANDPLSVFFTPHGVGSAEEITIAGSGGISLGGAGGGGSIGFLYPTVHGVLGGVTGFYRDGSATLWRGDIAVARPLGYRLTGGVSITAQAAGGPGRSDVGGGLNLGASWRGPSEFSRLVFHGGIRNVGKAVKSDVSSAPVFPAFTPYGGIAYTALRNEDVSVDLGGSVDFDSFQGITLTGNGIIRFSTGIQGVVGWRHTLGSGSDGVWPGMSAALSIPLGSGDTSTTGVHVGAQPDRNGNISLLGGFRTHLAGTDNTIPEIGLTVISPSRGSNEADQTVLLGPVADFRELYVTVSLEDDREVGVLSATIIDPDGRPVRTWDITPRDGAVPTGTITERLTSPLTTTTLDGSILWNIDAAEQDGFYRLEVTGTDGAENAALPRHIDVLVDTTSPDIVIRRQSVEKDGTVTQGEGNGTEDMILRMNQRFKLDFSFRDAERVSAYLEDEAGRQLFPLDVEIGSIADEQGHVEGSVTWNGRTLAGPRISEGAYRVVVRANDFIGNTSTVKSAPIVMQSEVPEFVVGVTDDVVAPDGDGRRDTTTIRTRLSPIEGLREWSILLRHEGTAETTAFWSGIDLPPEELVVGAAELPLDGRYTVYGESVYENGTAAEAPRRTITVDRVAPAAEIALSTQTVRPERGREVTVYFEGDPSVSRTEIYAEQVRSDGGGEVFPVATEPRLPEQFTWYMTARNGDLLGPGMYRLWAEVLDDAGNRTRTQTREVVLLERLGGAGVFAGRRVISPNGDGIHDDVVFALEGPADPTGEFSLTVNDETGEAVRRFRGELPMPERIVWDGRNERGLVAPDGRYRPVVEVRVPGLESIRSTGEAVTIDTRPPEGSLTLKEPTVVSPDGDGVQDELHFRLDIENPRDVVSSTLSVVWLDAEGRRIRDLRTSTASRGENTWSPVTGAGEILPDGQYRLVAELSDPAGNGREVMSEPFTIDTRPVSAFVRVDKGAINPGGEGEIAAVEITPVVSDHEGLQQWTVSIVAAATGETVYRQSGTQERPPRSISFPEAPDVATTEDGVYFTRFEAVYRHGPSLVRESPRFVVDSSAPVVDVEVTPQPFSPDGDGEDDVVSFVLGAVDESELQYWYLEVYDSRGAFFYDVGGNGPPPGVIRWDGVARNGERVISAEEYPWRLEVADTLGNVAIREGALAVDVLVERYNGGYRIQLPSITFPPDSSELILAGESAEGRRNDAVITRLVEILKRYPEYSIIVEGHAVNISGTEREEREELEPLSRRRAEAVRQALIQRGIPAALLTARGRGGTVPIVDHGDEEMRWKNRRVDFILQR